MFCCVACEWNGTLKIFRSLPPMGWFVVSRLEFVAYLILRVKNPPLLRCKNCCTEHREFLNEWYVCMYYIYIFIYTCIHGIAITVFLYKMWSGVQRETCGLFYFIDVNSVLHYRVILQDDQKVSVHLMTIQKAGAQIIFDRPVHALHYVSFSFTINFYI